MLSNRNGEYSIASPLKRILAFGIDLVFIILLITVSILLTNEILGIPVTPSISLYGFEIEMDHWAQQHFWEIVWLYSGIKFLTLLLYYVIFESSIWQATPGKRLLNLKVTGLDCERITGAKATIRFLGRMLSSILLIGYFMILFTKHRQGLHDLLAKTLVQDR